MIGDFLYNLQPIEAGGSPVILVVHDRRSLSQNVIAQNIDWEVPKDKILLLTGFWGLMATAGVTAINRFQARVMDDVFNVIYEIASRSWTGVVLRSDIQQTQAGGSNSECPQPVLVYSGHRIRVEGSYSAAAIGNILEGYVHGLLIPRGTLQLGALARL